MEPPGLARGTSTKNTLLRPWAPKRSRLRQARNGARRKVGAQAPRLRRVIVAELEAHILVLAALCALLDQKKGIAVHFLGGVFENVNRVAEFSNGGKHIDCHAFRAGSRLLQI